ncbi:MAG: DNA-processing protein DprA [Bacillota bacterium]
MSVDEQQSVLWLNRLTGHDVRLFRRLVGVFGSALGLFESVAAGRTEALEGFDPALVNRMKESASGKKIREYLAWLRTRSIEAIPITDPRYPTLLKEIYDPPSVLFVRGELRPEVTLPLAMVGARTCTQYGREVAGALAGALCEAGACIVSGLAHGIDSIGALAALSVESNDYPTVAVLGCGVDVVYPKEQQRLYEQIARRGAVISEFFPGTRPYASNFPMRNRIISGLSRGVIVVEAGEKSGALITANCALEQGRDVYSVPGRITDSMSLGTNRMIREGSAKPVFTVNDILEEYGYSLEYRPIRAAVDLSALDPGQKTIVELLKADARSFDELCELTGIGAAELNSTLTSLEFSEIIKQLPGRVYCL